MARFASLAALLLVTSLVVPAVLAAPLPSVSYGKAGDTARVVGGESVMYNVPLSIIAADGQSTVDLEIAYREGQAANPVAWAAGLVLTRSAGEQPPGLPELSGFDAAIALMGLREGSYTLTVEVVTPDNVAQYTSFLEVMVSAPGQGHWQTAGLYRFDFNVVHSPDADGDGLSDITEKRIGSDVNDFDTDDDGLTDCQEAEHTNVRECQDPAFLDVDGGFGTDPTKKDTDGDTLSDLEELNRGTDPTKSDTDGDGLTDEKEFEHKTDPHDPDTDGDALNDGDEIKAETNPLQVDTDGDGLTDGQEVHGTLNTLYGEAATDPKKPDSDGDGLTDCEEIHHTVLKRCPARDLETDGGWGTDPNKPDTDGDGILDVDEAGGRTDPTKADTDGDGLSDFEETSTHQTRPDLNDTDGDGLNDGAEISWGSKPLKPDTDGDGLTDGDEVHIHGTSPLLYDTDDDGLKDGQEVQVHGTDPAKFDTDGDGLDDGEEVRVYGTDPLLEDSDGDGLQDGAEVAAGTDPAMPDTDGDGWNDGTEVRVGSDPLDNGIVPSDVDGDKIADLEDADADGDGRPDEEAVQELSSTLSTTARIEGGLDRHDVGPNGSVAARLAWEPSSGDVQIWRATSPWTEVAQVEGAAGSYLDEASKDGAKYRITSIVSIGDKRVAAQPNATWFQDLPEVEVFVTGVRAAGDAVALRNGAVEARSFVIVLEYTDKDGKARSQETTTDVAPQTQEVIQVDLADAKAGSTYMVFWNDGGERLEVMEGQVDGEAGGDSSWLLWLGILVVGLLVVVGAALLVRKLR